MASLRPPILDLKNARGAMKDHLKKEVMRQLKKKIRSTIVNHFAGFWYVYAIILAIFLFFYAIAAMMSSRSQ